MNPLNGNMPQSQSHPKQAVWSSATSASPVVASNFGGSDAINSTSNQRGTRGTGVYSRGNWRGRGGRGGSLTLPRYSRQGNGLNNNNNNNNQYPAGGSNMFAVNNNNNNITVSRSSSFGMGGGGGTGQWSSGTYRGGRYPYRGGSNAYRGRNHDGRNGGGMGRTIDSMAGDGGGLNRPQQQEPLLGIDPMSPLLQNPTTPYNMYQDNRGVGIQPYVGSQAVDGTLNDVVGQFGSLSLTPNEQAPSPTSAWEMQQQQQHQAMSGLMPFPSYYQPPNAPMYAQTSMGNYYAAPSNGTTYYLPVGQTAPAGVLVGNPAAAAAAAAAGVNNVCEDPYCTCRQTGSWAFVGPQYGGYPNYGLPWGGAGYTGVGSGGGGWKPSPPQQPMQQGLMKMPPLPQPPPPPPKDQHSVDSTVVAFSPPMSDDGNATFDNLAAVIAEAGAGQPPGTGANQ